MRQKFENIIIYNKTMQNSNYINKKYPANYKVLRRIKFNSQISMHKISMQLVRHH